MVIVCGYIKWLEGNYGKKKRDMLIGTIWFFNVAMENPF